MKTQLKTLIKSTLLMVLALLAFGPNVYGANQIYVWTDDRGVTVFSDTPKPGAEIANISKKTINMPTTDTTIFEKIQFQLQTDTVQYTVKIIHPADQATIRSNEGVITLTASVNPKYERPFSLRLKRNGIVIATDKGDAKFLVKNIDRGTHTLQVELIDGKNNVTASSPVITVYLHRQSVLSPARQTGKG